MYYELWIGVAVVVGGAVGYWMGKRDAGNQWEAVLDAMDTVTEGEFKRVWDKAANRLLGEGE